MTLQTKLIIPLFFIVFQIQAQQIILSEDFESETLPNAWTQSTNASDGGWIMGTNTQLQSGYWSIADHGNIIATNDDECDCDKSVDYLILPELDLSESSNVALQFQNYFDGGTLFGGTEVATIEYSLNNGTSWQVLYQVMGTDDGQWDTQSFDISELAGNESVLLAFHYYDDGEWLFGWAIDDVLVFEPDGLDLALESIQVNSSIDVNNPTPIIGTVVNNGADVITSFDLTWSIGGDSYTINYIGLDIPPLGSFDFNHPDLLEILFSGTYNLTVSISNVNGVTDDNPENDVIVSEIQALEYGTLWYEGFEREYIYYHPESAPENCPLVFVCHGYTGTAQGIMNYSEFNAVADENGFAVCYPQGIDDSFGNTFFNVGYDFQSGETVDDVAFLVYLIDNLQRTYSLTEEDIFCTGLSNGGDFCYLLACEASDSFKAVAPVAGMILQDIMDDCNPQNEVSIFEIHGTQDNVTYFEGDPENNDDWGAYPSIPATISFFNELYSLDDQTIESLPNSVPSDGSTVISEKNTSDVSCTQVWLYTVQGGGHDWPGAWGNMDVSASEEVWNFFEQLCDNEVGVNDDQRSYDPNRTLIKIVDSMGREIKEQNNIVMFYWYSDGSVERKLMLE